MNNNRLPKNITCPQREINAIKRITLAFIAFTFIGFVTNGLGAYSRATPLIQVQLFEAHQPLHQVSVSGAFYLLRPSGRQAMSGNYRVKINHGQIQLFPATTTHTQQAILRSNRLVLEAANAHGIALQADKLPIRRYPAQLRIQSDAQGHLQFINSLPKPSYVAIVIGSETPPHWPLEALKAQAVLTQTRLSLLKPGTILGDSTQQEVFLGLDYLSPDAQKAVRSVWGQRLQYNGQTRPVYYHASCGGHTSSDRYFTPASNPGFPGVSCPYCKAAPFSKITSQDIPQPVFLKAFPQGMPRITKRDEAGRALAVRFANGQSESGYAFWMQLGQRLGWAKAPGTRFSLSQIANGSIRVQSNGAGHGVGLCQWGAAEMARQGKSHVEILRFYFPQAVIQKPPKGFQPP